MSDNQSGVVQILITARDMTKAALQSATQGLHNFKERLFSLQTLFEGLIASQVVRFGKSLLDAFGEQQQAVISLNAALRVTDRYSSQATARIQGMADEMQRLTTVSHTSALNISATIAQLATQLNPDQLAQAQKIVIGFSSAFHLSVDEATVLVGKALSGQRNELARYGVTIDTTGTQQQKFNQLLQKTAGFFQVAQDSTQSLQGQFAQMGNEIDDVKETLGLLLTRFLGLDTSTGHIRDSIHDFNEDLKTNGDQILGYAEIVKGVIQGIWGSVVFLTRVFFNIGEDIGAFVVFAVQSFGHFFAFFYKTGRVIGDTIVLALTGLAVLVEKSVNKVVDGVNWVTSHLNKALPTALQLPELDHWASSASAEFSAAKDSIVADAASIGDSLKGIKADGDATDAAWAQNTQDMKDGFSDLVKSWGTISDLMSKPLAPKVNLSGIGAATQGGGTNMHVDPSIKAGDDAQALTGQLTTLQNRLDAGVLSGRDFVRTLGGLTPAFVKLRDGGLLTSDVLSNLVNAFDKARQTANTYGAAIQHLDPEHQADQLEKLEGSLTGAFKAGAISANTFRAKTLELLPAFRALIDSGKVTGDKLTSLVTAFEDLRTQAQALGVDVGEALHPPSFGEALQADLAQAQGGVTDLHKSIADLSSQGIGAFSQAFGQAFQDMASGSKKAGDAMGAAFLNALSSVAAAFGSFFLGQALAALGMGVFLGPFGLTKGAAAAAELTAAAAAMFTVAGLASGAASRFGGGSGGGAGGATSQTNAVANNGTGDATIVIQGSLLDMSDPRQAEALAEAIKSLTGRRIVIQGT